jgi:hypothetical protein
MKMRREQMAQAGEKGVPASQQTTMIGKEWSLLSDAQKETYKEAAKRAAVD